MNIFDIVALLAYAAAVLALGWGSARGAGGEPAASLLLGERRMPAWAVLFSMVSTELSAATFIGVPHAAYTGNWSYLQLALGALLGKSLVATWVIPLYHARGYTTVYEFLGDRFGRGSHRAAAGCFAAGRILASGARLFIAALALSAGLGPQGPSLELAIVGCGVVAALYTRIGGIRSVIWTDVLQGAVFVFAAGALLAAVIPSDGLTGLLSWGSERELTRVIGGPPWLSLGDGSALLTAVAAGFFLTCATHATDHDMVQRLLTTRDARGGSAALMGSALLNFPLTILFLLIGTGLARFYANPSVTGPDQTGEVLAFFAAHELAPGVRGLVFAGLVAAAMSSLDSAICAIAATWVNDIAPRTRAGLARRLRRSADVVSVALIGAALAMAAIHRAFASQGGPANASLVEFALQAMAILYGGLLGVFALGFATRTRGSDRGAVAGLAVGSAVGLALFALPLWAGAPGLAWGWRIPLSAGLSFAVAAATRRTGPTVPPARE